MLVGGGVETFVLPGEVVAPVLGEVVVVVEGAEFEDGFGAVQAPAGAGDVEAVADQVAQPPSIAPVEIGQPGARAVS